MRVLVAPEGPLQTSDLVLQVRGISRINYISRVENGHTVPAIETLEKMARALEVPLYQLFYDGEEPPELPNLPKRRNADGTDWGSSRKDTRFLVKFRRLVGRVDEGDRLLLLHMAQKMARA